MENAKLPKFIGQGELSNPFIESAINTRFISFLVALANVRDIDLHELLDSVRSILADGEIKQD